MLFIKAMGVILHHLLIAPLSKCNFLYMVIIKGGVHQKIKILSFNLPSSHSK